MNERRSSYQEPKLKRELQNFCMYIIKYIPVSPDFSDKVSAGLLKCRVMEMRVRNAGIPVSRTRSKEIHGLPFSPREDAG